MTDQAHGQAASPARRIMDGLRDAVAGNFARVTIDGQTWARTDNLSKGIDPELAKALASPVPAPVGLEREALEKALGGVSDRTWSDLQTAIDRGTSVEFAREWKERFAMLRAALSSTDGRSSAGQSESAEPLAWHCPACEAAVVVDDTPRMPVESLPTRQLVEFFKWAMREGPWDGSDLDGDSVQDKAESLGLIVKTKFDPEKHDGPDWAFSPGDDYYEFAPALRCPAESAPLGGPPYTADGAEIKP